MSPRRKTWFVLIAIIILTFIVGYIDYPKNPDINLNSINIPYEKELKLHLGLDLQGGTHLVYEADLSRIEPANYDEALAGVRDVIERRVNILGVSEPIVQTNNVGSSYRVIIELAGVKDVNEAINMIGETPSLDFRETSEEDIQEDLTEGLTVEGEGDDAKIIDTEGNEVNLEELQKKLEEQQNEYPGFVMTNLTGQHLSKAGLQFDQQTNTPIIALEFNEEGKQLFAEITEKNVGKPLAIFLDNEVISAPNVNEPIRDGQAVIQGDFTIEEAKELSMRLNAGALPVPINLISQQTVGASLGKISVEKSFLAGILGFVLICLYMIINYRLPGILAVLSLIVYALIVLALFKLVPITLTLAGIAGFILSIGMAVDANVLIFERMKEELRLGKSLGNSINEGFKHAWTSIRDSNISTLITCLILAWFGTSFIQGFAITLGLGVLVSMFSAIVITKNFLKISNNKFLSSKLWLYGKRK